MSSARTRGSARSALVGAGLEAVTAAPASYSVAAEW
jgi:hypothetical protein